MKLSTYPGPFHTTSGGRVRIAAWVNCCGCGTLFIRATNDLHNKAKTLDGHHARLYCSSTCHALNQPRKGLPMVECSECHQMFQATHSNKAHLRPGRHFCSRQCYRMWKGRHQSAVWHKAWDVYMAYNQLQKSEINCEYCGSFDRVGISRKNLTRQDYRIGNLEAACNRCATKKHAGKPMTKLSTEERLGTKYLKSRPRSDERAGSNV